MSVNTVTADWDDITQRWELAVSGRAGTTDLIEEHPGVMVGRDTSGNTVELVLDADADTWPSTDTIDTIREAFGDAVADVLSTTTPTDGVSLTIDATPTGDLALAASAPLPGEPGVLVERRDGGYDVTIDRVTLQVHTSPTGLIISTPDIRSDGWWVRISDNESGNLLAMGPLRTPTDSEVGSQSTARISFGLTTEHDDTLVTVTTDPLDPVPPRAQRRRRWIDGLLDSADAAGIMRSGAARRDAERARDAARAIGDDERTRRAHDTIRRITRRRWIVPLIALVGAVAVVVAVGAVAFALTADGRNDAPNGAPSSPASRESSATAATPQTTPVTVPRTIPVAAPPSSVDEPAGAFLGPAEYRWGNTAVGAQLVGSTRVEQQSTIQLRVMETITIDGSSYGSREPTITGPGDEEAARSNCLTATSVPASAVTFSPVADSTFDVILERVDSDETASIEPLLLSAPIETFSSDPESCRTATMTADGALIARTFAQRRSEVVTIALPDYIGPGRWTLQLSNLTDTATVDTPIVFDVAAR